MLSLERLLSDLASASTDPDDACNPAATPFASAQDARTPQRERSVTADARAAEFRVAAWETYRAVAIEALCRPRPAHIVSRDRDAEDLRSQTLAFLAAHATQPEPTIPLCEILDLARLLGRSDRRIASDTPTELADAAIAIVMRESSAQSLSVEPRAISSAVALLSDTTLAAAASALAGRAVGASGLVRACLRLASRYLAIDARKSTTADRRAAQWSSARSGLLAAYPGSADSEVRVHRPAFKLSSSAKARTYPSLRMFLRLSIHMCAHRRRGLWSASRCCSWTAWRVPAGASLRPCSEPARSPVKMWPRCWPAQEQP